MARRSLLSATVIAAVLLPRGVPAQDSDDGTYFVDVDGQATRVLTIGLDQRIEGDPVILLQAGAGGGIDDWSDWAAQVAELAPVIAYDRVGLGQSPYDGAVPTVERVNRHLHRLLDVLDVPPPYVLVGHSWGGPLNLFYAASHPNAVRGLVHLDPGDPRSSPLEYMAASSEAELARRWAERDSFFADAALSSGERAEDAYINDFERTPVYQRRVPPDPRIPTAFVFGMRAPDVGDDWAPHSEEVIASAFRLRLERVAPSIGQRRNGAVFLSGDAGHVVYRDDPALSLYAVRHVLARIDFPVDRAVLEAFVGDFEHDSGMRMSISLTEDGLTSRIEGQSATFLRAISDVLYRVGSGSVTLEFLREGDAVDSLIVHQNGEHTFRRVRD